MSNEELFLVVLKRELVSEMYSTDSNTRLHNNVLLIVKIMYPSRYQTKMSSEKLLCYIKLAIFQTDRRNI